MTDPRVHKLAHVLVHYSLNLKRGQIMRIQGEAAAFPLIKALFAEAIKVGAHPHCDIIIPDNEEAFYKYGTDKQLQFISPMLKLEYNRIDAFVSIWASENSRYLSSVDPKRQAMHRKARRPLIQKMFRRVADKSLSWVGTQFPTLAEAQDADMSLSAYEDFVYGAGHLHLPDPVSHWRKVANEQERLVKILNTLDQIHIRTNDTDLKLRVKGRRWINCAGTENFPDGELFTGPIENSVEGKIHFSFPAVYVGREVSGVTLQFKRGKVVSESADKGLEFLSAMLNMDKGARFVGEFAIGTNYEITRHSRNTLFDEKIGGTCHLAVGSSLPESGGLNKSSLHWDMVCDLRSGGEISADGKVIHREGKFVI